MQTPKLPMLFVLQVQEGSRSPRVERRIGPGFFSDQNVIPLDLYRISSHGKRTRDNLSRCHVELIAMPRTSDYRSVDPSLSQWPAAMRADVVQGVEGAVDVEEGNRFPSHLDNLARAARYLIDFCDLHHGNLDPPYPVPERNAEYDLAWCSPPAITVSRCSSTIAHGAIPDPALSPHSGAETYLHLQVILYGAGALFRGGSL